MQMRDHRVAQIVREFMDAYVLSAEIGAQLLAGNLDFAPIDRLVADSEESSLFRLKEECHALFRFDRAHAETELHAEELFDLAVGALFHEGMKFREGCYLTTTYGPRLERMLEDGSASGSLAESFRRVFEAGYQRRVEAGAETAQLFDETRDQLVILLRQLPRSGAVARSLVEDRARTEQVFGRTLEEVLEDIYGSAEAGDQLAVESLVESGHFGDAVVLLERRALPESDRFRDAACAFAQGMECYYAGNFEGTVERLSRWIDAGNSGPASWERSARKALDAVAADGADLALAGAARRLVEQITPPHSS